MTILKLGIGVTALFSALVSAPGFATTINFDNLADGAVVTNQYAGVTFSSSPGSQILTTAQNLGSTLPNFICSGVGSAINCVDTVFVDFASGTNGLSFVAVGDNNTGVNGAVSVFAGMTLLGSVNIIGDGNAFTPYLVNLSAFSGITRIAITTNDIAGLGYDDFTYNSAVGGVPEPAAWAMMLAGFGIIGSAMRRRVRGAPASA